MPARYASRVCREARLKPSLPLKLVDIAAAVPLAAPLIETTASTDDSALTVGEAIPLGFSLAAHKFSLAMLSPRFRTRMGRT